MNPNLPFQANPGYMPHSMSNDVMNVCHRFMNYHVIAHMSDGSQRDGIIDGVDAEGIIMLIPEEIDDEEATLYSTRQFGFGPRFRRFHRQRFPFNSFIFPFFRPFPFFPPPFFVW